MVCKYFSANIDPNVFYLKIPMYLTPDQAVDTKAAFLGQRQHPVFSLIMAVVTLCFCAHYPTLTEQPLPFLCGLYCHARHGSASNRHSHRLGTWGNMHLLNLAFKQINDYDVSYSSNGSIYLYIESISYLKEFVSSLQ